MRYNQESFLRRTIDGRLSALRGADRDHMGAVLTLSRSALRRLAALALNLVFLQAILLGGGVACGAAAASEHASGHAAMMTHGSAPLDPAAHAAHAHSEQHTAASSSMHASHGSDAHDAAACSGSNGAPICGMSHTSGHCATATSCTGGAGLPTGIAAANLTAGTSEIAALRAIEPPSITTAPLHPPPRA
jgi:hypothetical protein